MAALATAAFVEDEVAHRARIDAARAVETNKYGLVVYTTPHRGVLQGKGTRAQERARGKQARLAKMLAGGPFLTARTHRVGVPLDVCCETRDCASRFSVSNASQEGLDRVVWYRNIFQALDEEKRRQFIARRIRYEVVGEGGDGSAHKRWTLESPDAISTMVRGGRDVQIDVGTRATTVVCGDFFCYVLGITKNKMYQPTIKSPEFQTSVPRASNPRGANMVGKAEYVAMWLLQLAAFYLHDPAADQVILPFADKRAVYDMYAHESEDPELKAKWAPYGVPSRVWFYAVWNNDVDCAKIKVRKTLRFSLCPECVKFIEIRQHVLNDVERQAVKAAESTHHKSVRMERISYYLRRQLATLTPMTCFSIIIDGADQSAFGSPHHYIHSKGRTTHTHSHTLTHLHATAPLDDDNNWRIATHLMGALVHGHECHGFTFLTNIKHGTNITIETLHRVLLYHFEQHHRRPFVQRTLYLQLDNTTKQCKSKYMLGYMALLVAWFVFAETMLSFLIVGHTHEDIDQMFSRIAVWLRKNNATSRIGFRDAILKAFTKPDWTGTTQAADIESAANISEFLEGFLAPMGSVPNGPGQREGITSFHQFKFTMLEGAVIMRVREWSGDPMAPWHGLTPESTHHVVFDKEVPTPDDLAANCPPAQRGTKPTDPKYMTTNSAGVVTSNHTSRTRKGVEAIIKNRNVTGAAAEDLHKCLKMMESPDPLPFHWDVTMYRVHVAHGANAVAVDDVAEPGNRDDLGEQSADSEADHLDQEDEGDEARQLHFDDAVNSSEDDVALPPDAEGFTPKTLLVGGIYLVRMGARTWGLAKYVSSLRTLNTHPASRILYTK
jgi:hypothetical protein